MDTALDLVLEDGQFWVAPTIKSQAHLDRLIASPLCVPIGDGFAHHPERHRGVRDHAQELRDVPARARARTCATGACCRSPEAIRKITAEPARRLGLTDRGRLAEGFAADLVVFDPATDREPSRRRRPGGPPGRHRAGHGQRPLGRRRRRRDGGADRGRPLAAYSQSGKCSRRSRAASVGLLDRDRPVRGQHPQREVLETRAQPLDQLVVGAVDAAVGHERREDDVVQPREPGADLGRLAVAAGVGGLDDRPRLLRGQPAERAQQRDLAVERAGRDRSARSGSASARAPRGRRPRRRRRPTVIVLVATRFGISSTSRRYSAPSTIRPTRAVL